MIGAVSMGLFDFDGDGKTSLGEQWIAYNIFKECTKEDDDDDSYLYDDEEDYSWREFCDDGSEYGISPEDYEEEWEYEEALEEAKYAWRDECEDGVEYGVDPEDYETTEEYEEALNEAKYAWRDECEDGVEYGVDPEDYETAEEYEEALEEIKYAWRDNCEDGFEYGVDADDYETLEEYEEALREAKKETALEESNVTVPVSVKVSVGSHSPNGIQKENTEWRKKYFRTETYGLNLRDYLDEREFLRALSIAREEALEIALNDKNIYFYCGVIYENNPYPYHYRTNDLNLKIGDKVIVPVGYENKEVVAEVVSVEQHTRLTVPYPVEKCKFIIRKYDE
jgi:hypothetical protein